MVDMQPSPQNYTADARALLDLLVARDGAASSLPLRTVGRSALAMYLHFHLGPAADHFLWRDGAGAAVAYSCVCLPDSSREEWVAPANSWRMLTHPSGRTASLLDAMAGHAEALLGNRASSPVLTEAYDGDAAMAGFLKGRGYGCGEYLGPYMMRALDAPILSAPLPPSYRIRPLAPDSEIHERASAAADGFAGMGEPPAWVVDSVRHTVEFNALRGFGEADLVAVTDAGAIASHAGIVHDPATGIGELEGVATRGAHVRRGLSRAVVIAALRHMRAAGMQRAVVRTSADRAPAIALYESVGFRVVDRLFRYTRAV